MGCPILYAVQSAPSKFCLKGLHMEQQLRCNVLQKVQAFCPHLHELPLQEFPVPGFLRLTFFFIVFLSRIRGAAVRRHPALRHKKALFQGIQDRIPVICLKADVQAVFPDILRAFPWIFQVPGISLNQGTEA